jgi:hypothetical protein
MAPGGFVPIQFGGEDGLIVAFYRVQNGTAADTVTIPASNFDSGDIRFAVGVTPSEVTHALSFTQANTQIVFTMAGTPASTAIAYDVILVGRRNT